MRSKELSDCTIDVLIPALNESACIGPTIKALFVAAAAWPCRIELIVVDDGSTDGTPQIVRRLAQRFPIRLLELTRNFGKEAALLAGLDHAHGDATVIMDADLQHPVAAIGEFIERWQEGYDCVFAVRANRNDESVLKRTLTRLFYLFVNGGSRSPIPRTALDFRLPDRAAVEALCSMRERVRFSKGLYAWLGFRSLAVPVVPEPRHGGASHFSLRALLRLGRDGMTSFSDWPLVLSGLTGMIVASASLAYGVYITLDTLFFGIDVPGWATLTVALCFIGGLQLLFLGVIGQYVRALFIEAKQRPNYLIKKTATAEPLEFEPKPVRSAHETLPPARLARDEYRELATTTDAHA